MSKGQRNYARQPVVRAKSRHSTQNTACPPSKGQGGYTHRFSASSVKGSKRCQNGYQGGAEAQQGWRTSHNSQAHNPIMHQGVPLFKLSRKEQEQMQEKAFKPGYQLDSEGEINGNVLITHAHRLGHHKNTTAMNNHTVKKRNDAQLASYPVQHNTKHSEARPQSLAPRAKKLRLRDPNQKVQAQSRRLREVRENLDNMEPIRLQKALAASGIGSRREMEAWIGAGLVTINGKKAALGDRVGPHDRIQVKGEVVKLKWPDRLPRVIMYHKEEGEIVSSDDPGGRVTIFERLPQTQSSRWVAIGRLDINTSGLLLLTTSGELANRMMHPSFEIEREYAVRVLGHLSADIMDSMIRGVELEDGVASFERIYQKQASSNGESASANQWFNVVIKEGRNREVRRIFEYFGLTVSRLMRVRFGHLGLPPRLKRGQFYELNPSEVAAVMRWHELTVTGRRKEKKGHLHSKPAT